VGRDLGRAQLGRFDGITWTDWDWAEHDILFDQRGIASMKIRRDDTVWLGMGDGLIRFDGETFTLYDTANSPLPGETVAGIDFRDVTVDGAVDSDDFFRHLDFFASGDFRADATGDGEIDSDELLRVSRSVRGGLLVTWTGG